MNQMAQLKLTSCQQGYQRKGIENSEVTAAHNGPLLS